LKELVIPVTVYSDAHDPFNLINGFEEAVKMLKAAGFDHVHEFIGGEWIPVKI
jgi:hypothetical protein